MKRLSCLALSPLVLLAACGASADPAEVKETLRLTEKAHLDAIAARDVNGIMKLYEEDAVVVVPATEPVSGSKAIRAYYDGMVADPNLAIQTEPGESWVSAAGDLAVTTYDATFTYTDAASGERRTVPMNNKTVWTKATGSTWMIVSDYNVVLPDAGEAAGEAL